MDECVLIGYTEAGCDAYVNKLRLYIRRWRETKDPLNNFTTSSLSVEPGDEIS